MENLVRKYSENIKTAAAAAFREVLEHRGRLECNIYICESGRTMLYFATKSNRQQPETDWYYAVTVTVDEFMDYVAMYGGFDDVNIDTLCDVFKEEELPVLMNDAEKHWMN